MTKSRLARPSSPAFRPEHWLIAADMMERLHPTETLVVAPVVDGEVVDYLPYPLPLGDDALSRQVLSAMVANDLQQYPGLEWIAVCTFSDSSSVRPWNRLQTEIWNRVHLDGIHLTAAFYVSERGWGSYTCDDPECRGPRAKWELILGVSRLKAAAKRSSTS